MTDRVTLRDRLRNARHAIETWRAALSLYRALGRRGRHGVWVFWISLDTVERERYVAFLRVAMQRCWHLARDPDVTLPWQPTAEDLMTMLGSEKPQ